MPPADIARPDPARPTAVVFDLGGVLIDWNPRYLYRQLFDDEAEMESFLADVVSPAWNGQQDAGRTWAEAVAVLSREHPEHRELIAAYWHRWHETLGDAIHETVDVLAELRETGVRLLALSNWSAETFPVARPRYPFLEWFEGILISGEVEVAKPDPRIFHHLLDRFRLDAATTVFIDDSAANVDAAARLGIVALRFTGATALRADLVGLGLLDADVPASRSAHDGHGPKVA
jgi:2-haloacid dehalogenase